MTQDDSIGEIPHDRAVGAERGQPARLGRKRDPSRDTVILDAALEVLAEAGFDGMTMDMVAVRAKAGKGTVYRRWPSKAEMVLDAVGRMEDSEVDRDRLPDTGTLRGDLIAMIRPSSLVEGERRLKVMAGLASMMSRHAELAEAGNAAVVEPWVGTLHVLMQRAVESGEVPASADIETVSRVIPSMAAYRVFIQREPFDPGLPRLTDRRRRAAGAPSWAGHGRTCPDAPGGSVSVSDTGGMHGMHRLTQPARPPPRSAKPL